MTHPPADTSSGPMVTDWIQSGATVVGIFLTLMVAVGISRREHDRQVLHQSKRDVAEALTVLRLIMDEFFPIKTLAEISAENVGPDNAQAELSFVKEAAERSEGHISRLDSLSKLIQLTSPAPIGERIRALVAEVGKFRLLMSRTINAHTKQELMARMGQPEPLGPLTSDEAYRQQWDRIIEAENLLTLVVMDYEVLWAPKGRIHEASWPLWMRFESWAGRKMDKSS